MDFIVGLPRTPKGYDSIWMIIDRFTKSAHFIPMKTIYHAKTYAELYIARIVSLHGVPRTITLNLLTTTATKRVWKWHLSKLFMVGDVEHHSTSLNPVNGSHSVQIWLHKPKNNHLKRAQSRQKSYSDKSRRPLKGDHVYLRVSPMKGVHRFGVKGKLALRYIGPFKITEQCGSVAYRLELPSHLAAVHDVFHVLQLKKCMRVPEEVVDTSQIQIEPDLTYEEQPIKILDQKQRSTRRRTINFYKVQWSNHSEEEATWEQEEYLQTKYPGFLPSTSNEYVIAVLQLDLI
ncbi:LOW QUALITY PROTEIN: hypothetical protein U9M48_023742 [Paspalum notatum var. saurae]|uniref:Chromo domain-containing protein n=1 Tax=Paspalum notatum var. saurae TaxID=547442 RepID=A0AAQ3TRA3_PASNO